MKLSPCALPTMLFYPCHCSACLMAVAYEELKDSDGFLYIKYSGENTFGGCVASDVDVDFRFEELQDEEAAGS